MYRCSRLLSSATAAAAAGAGAGDGASKHLPTPLTNTPLPDGILFDSASGIENDNAVYHLTLNRPKAMNTLTLDMYRFLTSFYTSIKAIHDAGDADLVGAIILRGAGGKAFCAGGDLNTVLGNPSSSSSTNASSSSSPSSSSPPIQTEFTYTLYQTAYALAALPIPHISFWEGYTIGGGLGVSMLGSHRLACETTAVSLPEVQNGIIPGASGTLFLPLATSKYDGLGMYLALTGAPLKSVDAVHARLATHFVPRALMPRVERTLTHESNGALRSVISDKHQVVNAAIDDALLSPEGRPLLDLQRQPFSLAPHLETISRCFGAHVPDVETVVDALRSDGGEWAKQQADLLTIKSPPTVLKVTFELVRRAPQHRSIEDVLRMEYPALERAMLTSDTKKSLTAKLSRSKETPTWDPPTLKDVSNEAVEQWLHLREGSVAWHPTLPYPGRT